MYYIAPTKRPQTFSSWVPRWQSWLLYFFVAPELCVSVKPLGPTPASSVQHFIESSRGQCHLLLPKSLCEEEERREEIQPCTLLDRMRTQVSI